MIIRIDNDSCGELISAPNGIEIGQICEIKLHDENGNSINQLGYIAEILEE